MSWLAGFGGYFLTPKPLLSIAQIDGFNVAENLIRTFWAVITAAIVTIVTFLVKRLLKKFFNEKTKEGQ